MKIIHAADLHLDSPLLGLERYEGAPAERLRRASREATENLVELCLEQEARLLLLAGDLYDGDWQDYNTGLFLVHQLGRLARAGVRVVLVRGNHDARSQITRNLRLPPGVEELPTRRPGTVVLEELGVAVHGQGYARREVSEDLSRRYPEPVAGLLNIGLLHTALDGRAGHDPYAPCTADGLSGRGYDYWALGHVHRHEVVRDDPWIVFSGALQGRHARETGPKGAVVLTVDDGRVTAAELQPLDVVRWACCSVDASGARAPHDVVDRAREALAAELERADDRLLAARVEVRGPSPAHRALCADPERWTAEVRACTAELGEAVWVEKVLLSTRSPAGTAELSQRDDPVGALLRGMADLREDPALLAPALEELAELKAKLPREYRDLPDALRLETPEELGALLPEVEQLLVTRLVEDPPER